MPWEALKREILPHLPGEPQRFSFSLQQHNERMQERGIHRLGGYTESLVSARGAWVIHVVEPVIAPVGPAEFAAFIRSIHGVVRDADGALGVGT